MSLISIALYTYNTQAHIFSYGIQTNPLEIIRVIIIESFICVEAKNR